MLTLLACAKSDSRTSNEEQAKASAEQQKAITVKSAGEQELKSSAEETTLTTPSAPVFKTVEWTELMPKEDLDALINPPSYVTDVEDGSFEDQISSKIQNNITPASDDRYQQALVSTRIIPEMDGQAIRVAGFIVPLEFGNKQTITQFFLVPFFGACIHVPPPPPNQIIFVNYSKGITLDNLYDPFLISGVLKTSMVENEMATAAYSMQMQSFEAYTE